MFRLVLDNNGNQRTYRLSINIKTSCFASLAFVLQRFLYIKFDMKLCLLNVILWWWVPYFGCSDIMESRVISPKM